VKAVTDETAPATIRWPFRSIVIAMIGTRARSEVIALIAVVVPRSASFVAIVVMMVAGSNPHAAGTNVDFRGKCGCRKDESGGCDCSKNVSTHWAYSLMLRPSML
jgi:hypothetical protein